MKLFSSASILVLNSFSDVSSLSLVAKSSCKAIGVQTDLNDCPNLSQKLQAIWGLPSDQKIGRNLVSQLFAICSTDIDVLFGFISTSTLSKTMEPLVAKCSVDMASQSSVHPSLSSEAEKVSCFYSALSKVRINPIASYTC